MGSTKRSGATYGMALLLDGGISVFRALASIPDRASWSRERVIHKLGSTEAWSQGVLRFWVLGHCTYILDCQRHRWQH